MKTYELMCVYDNCKSFYKKAIVKEKENEIELYSYGVLVAKIKVSKYIMHDNVPYKTIEVYNTRTQTTVRHIKEFARQNGFGVYDTKTLKEIERKCRF